MSASLFFIAALPVSHHYHQTPFIQRSHRHHHAAQASRTLSLHMSTSTSGPNDLLIVGAGNLGRLIGTEWRRAFPDATIVGETRSETSHHLLTEAGITPTVAGSSSEQFPNVVFCAPPSQSDDYPGAVAASTTRVIPGGRMAFTSSGSVHGPTSLDITERTPVAKEGRALVLAQAEKQALSVPEGHVVRLAGLYNVDRGAHTFWLKRGTVSGSPEALVNLVHYQDAASAVVAVLRAGPEVEDVEKKEGRIYLVCGKNPVSRRGVCEAALKHPKFADFGSPILGDEAVDRNRRYDNSWTRQVLGWKPEFEGFKEFMEADAKKYNETIDVASG